MYSHDGFVFDRRHLLMGSLALMLAAPLRLSAQAARPMLSVTEPDGTVRHLEEADIAALPWHEIVTETRWTEGVQTFRGPLLKDVLTAGGRTRADLIRRTLLMTALNDFGIAVPASDAWEYDPILAREMNGRPMRVRDKGPLWLVYPRDQRPEIQNAVMDERWIWQLSGIEVR